MFSTSLFWLVGFPSYFSGIVENTEKESPPATNFFWTTKESRAGKAPPSNQPKTSSLCSVSHSLRFIWAHFSSKWRREVFKRVALDSGNTTEKHRTPSSAEIQVFEYSYFYIYFRFLCEVDINDFRSNSIMRTNSSSILTRTKVSNNCIKGFGKVRARICALQRQQFSNGEPEGWW